MKNKKTDSPNQMSSSLIKSKYFQIGELIAFLCECIFSPGLLVYKSPI